MSICLWQRGPCRTITVGSALSGLYREGGRPMRRVVFYLFIIAVFLAAPLAALPRGRLSRCHPCAHGHGRANRRRALPRCVGQLPGMAAGGFSHAGGVFWRYSGSYWTISGTWGHCRAGTGAALWDALYPSSYYPFSHLCTGQQGRDPRLWLPAGPAGAGRPRAGACTGSLGQPLPHPGWADPGALRRRPGRAAPRFGHGHRIPAPTWSPANTAVRQYIADAVGELCANYDVDGIHFDDYFYPTTDPSFDAADYAASGTALTRDDWRRENVNALVELCHATARRYGVRFGVAPVGTPSRTTPCNTATRPAGCARARWIT